MGHMAGSTTQCQRSIAVPIITKGFKLSRGFAASGKRTGRISACPPLQCAALGQRLFVVLAEDCRRPHIKTSLARYQLRQLRHWVCCFARTQLCCSNYLLFVISIETNTMILKGDEVLPSRLKDRPRRSSPSAR